MPMAGPTSRPALVGKPGGTTPNRNVSPEQAEAEEELLARLVALNAERAEEERRGLVRWLRPEYQAPEAPRSPSRKTWGSKARSTPRPRAPSRAPGPPGLPTRRVRCAKHLAPLVGQ